MMTPLHRLAANARLRLGAAMLMGMLQRLPAVRVIASAAEQLLASPSGAVIKAAGLALAALGAVDSVAGATTYTLTTGNPAHPSPYTVTEGSQIAAVAFGLTPVTQNMPQSWTIAGDIPPGLEFGPPGGPYLTGPGEIDTAAPYLLGTPTTPGTYTMELEAYEEAGAVMGPGLYESGTLTYTVVVNSSTATPTPTPTPGVTPTPTPTPAAGAPVFTTEPASITTKGGTVVLNAFASGNPIYQWERDGSDISGATEATLVLTNGSTLAATYACKATNVYGQVTSTPADVILTNTSDPGKIVNISARAFAGTGGNIIFGGFAIGGSGTSGNEAVLIRGSGPALVPYGVAGTLPDPQLALFSGATGDQLDENQAWGTPAASGTEIAATAAQVGAFAWPDRSSHDVALLEQLPAGSYTAQVSGESGDTGVALAEVYDATPAWASPTLPHLVNLSARVYVNSGATNALFAGFSIQGDSAVTVLVRASGPALAAFGVAGVLPDPELSLQTATGTVILVNQGWGGAAAISDAATQVGAFAWTSASSLDSAVLITLQPGNYVANVSGASGDSGVTLVEVYLVP